VRKPNQAKKQHPILICDEAQLLSIRQWNDCSYC